MVTEYKPNSVDDDDDVINVTDVLVLHALFIVYGSDTADNGRGRGEFLLSIIELYT